MAVTQFLSLRVDEEFLTVLRELRRLLPGPDIPSKSDAIRIAVANELARLREERRRK